MTPHQCFLLLELEPKGEKQNEKPDQFAKRAD
jgi:hypothetical protein